MKSGLDDVRWIELPTATDDRGTLVEATRDIPFEIRRVFYLHHVSANRGEHAHRDTDQLVIGISGTHVIEVMDAERRLRFVLDDPNRGLYLPRMTFASLLDFSTDAVSLVLANTDYDPDDYLRSFDEYLAVLESSPA